MFREKYRKDNELIKAPEKIPEVIFEMKITDNRRKLANIGIIAACLLMAVCALTVMPGRGQESADQSVAESVTEQIEAVAAEDYSQIYETIVELNERNRNRDFYFMADGSVEVLEEAATDSTSKAPTNSSYGAADDAVAAGRGDYSQTNTQFADVDEGDIIKNDGRYIYRIIGNEIVIIDALDMKVVSRSEIIEPQKDGSIEGWAQELYVSGDRMAVLFSEFVHSEENEWMVDTNCVVRVYDITDRARPAAVGEYSQCGSMCSSRLIDGYIYIISTYSIYTEPDKERPETYVPWVICNDVCRTLGSGDIMLPAEPAGANYTVITSISLADGEDFAETQAALGFGGTVYADSGCIILACAKSSEETVETQENGENVTVITGSGVTELVRYDILEGAITPGARGEVPGGLLNQFSIDRYKDVVRVVTTVDTWEQKIYTDGVDRYEYEGSTSNSLYTLDKDMNIIGSIEELAEDERVYSVRFSGDIGYFVTFRQVDPLYAVDLSDPTAPKILSALKIPGFSQYMHPYAPGLLFGIGMDADEETGRTKGLKLSMFDISDPANVTEKHKLVLEDVWWSEVLYNHKAAVISAEHNIIAFPADGGYLVYGYDESGFVRRFELDVSDMYQADKRGLFIGGSFYICSSDMLCRYDMQTFALLDKLSIE